MFELPKMAPLPAPSFRADDREGWAFDLWNADQLRAYGSTREHAVLIAVADWLDDMGTELVDRSHELGASEEELDDAKAKAWQLAVYAERLRAAVRTK